MKTLKEQIAEAKYEISQRREAIKVYERLVTFLEEQRVNCDHEWDAGVKGWEHEGVHCVKCGINDQYAATLKRMKK
jgi:hypothetical protein